MYYRRSMSDTAIKITNLTKIYKLYGRNRDRLKDSLGFSKKANYKEHYALKNVEMEVKTGESVGIIGVNGSGKSTILKITDRKRRNPWGRERCSRPYASCGR